MPSFTYLIPADGVYPGKTISFLPDGNIQQVKAAHSSLVFAEKYDFNDFDEMCNALFTMVDVAKGFIVRGDVAATHVGTNKAFRRTLGKLGDGGVFFRYDPQWLCLDVDGILKPDGIDPIKEPEAAIKFVIESLPPYFHESSCWWQWSSSQSLPGSGEVLKCHLFYFLHSTVPEGKLKEWAKSNKAKHKIDPAVMGSNQPIYILPPRIKGAQDWLRARCGVYRGTFDKLDLSLFTARKFKDKSNIIPIDQNQILAKYLINVGDGEGGEGFNDPIKKAIGAVLAKSGEVDREQLKADIRRVVAAAPVSPGRSAADVERYTSDAYLDPLIEAITLREGESHKQSMNHYEALRDRYVYITNINRFYDMTSGNYVTKEALNMATSRIGRNVADLLVNDDDFTVVDQITYCPGRDRICSEISIPTGELITCFNIFRPAAVHEESSESAAFFVEHVKLLAGNDEVYHHMMDWMAHNVQRPGIKMMYAMLIQGKQGTGKSALMEALKGCLGLQNVRPVETQELLGNFTAWTKGKCLAVLEEIRDSTDRFGVYNRLKPLITAPTITLNEKNVGQVEMWNRINLMMFTQYENAVPMDDDDRRLFIHFSPMEPQDEKYYDHLFKEVIEKHPGAIRQMFLEWDLSHFNRNARAPMTDSKQFLRDFAGPPATRILRLAIKECEWPMKCDIIIANHILEATPHRFKSNETNLSITLKTLGAVCIGRKMIKGQRQTVWSVRNHERWANAQDRDVENNYKQPFYDNFSKTEGYMADDEKQSKF